MSLRDPAARFESAVLTVLRNRRRNPTGVRHCTICPEYYFIWNDALSYLRDFRNTSAAGHSAAVRLYRRSVARPQFSQRIGTIYGGNNMMTAQVDYLRGVNCSHVELNFVCQETLATDWAALLKASNLTTLLSRQNASEAPVVSMEQRSSNAHADDIASSRLGPADRDFVRRCMYPWDDALHSMACPHARMRIS